MLTTHHTTLAIAISTILLTASACGTEIIVPNSVATIAIPDAPIASEDGIIIRYTLADEEGDDQDLKVEICEGSPASPTRCGAPFEGANSDGTDFVPTHPNGQPLIHYFVWEVECGRVDENGLISTDLSQTYFAKISARSDSSSAATSPTFTLTDLGIQEQEACSR